MPMEQRFWLKIKKSRGCWEWQGATSNGYGTLLENGTGSRAWYVHRYSWTIHFGPIPEGMYVCHTCDNRICIRPQHLWLGTNAENLKDMHSKGRGHIPSVPPGENHHLAKLTNTQVLSIREAHASGETETSIASRFGVTQPNIGYIVRRHTWKHI
jgi:hypothetical protein